MITKRELCDRIEHWRNECEQKSLLIRDLGARLAQAEKYAHVNEDMALALARSQEVIGQMSTTISTLVGRRN